jgi:GNAT superfamily N-acetyltransferase
MMSTIRRIQPENRGNLASLFAEHRPSFLIDTVLEGHLGSAVADDERTPRVAQLAYADVIVLGGDPSHPMAQELVERLPVDKGIWPAPEGWRDLLFRVHGENLVPIERYSFSGHQLDLGHLRSLEKQIPEGYQNRRIDLHLARLIDADSSLISEDHVHNFASPEDFVKRGIGFCILKGGRIVSGASSYAICNSGIEVQVNTHPDFRRKGLATTVSAALLVYCLERGIEAHWDAGNAASAKLAKKLGYAPSGTYEMLVRIG